MDKNTDDIVFAVKDREGYYFTGYNKWEKQVRKAKLYRSYNYAKEARDNIKFIEHDTFIVRVRIMELDECCYED